MTSAHRSSPLSRLSPLLLLVAPLLVTPCLGGCNSNPESPPTWVDGDLAEVPSDRILWQMTLVALERLGYPRRALDRNSLTIESGWKNDLAPFSGEGFRRQAVVHLEPVGPSAWHIRARVKKQVNQSLVKPLDPQYAEWEWVADDEVAAQILVAHIRSRFDPALQMREREDALTEKLRELEGR